MYCFQHCFIYASQIPLCRRMLGTPNQGLLRLRHWQSDALTTQLDLIHIFKYTYYCRKCTCPVPRWPWWTPARESPTSTCRVTSSSTRACRVWCATVAPCGTKTTNSRRSSASSRTGAMPAYIRYIATSIGTEPPLLVQLPPLLVHCRFYWYRGVTVLLPGWVIWK